MKAYFYSLFFPFDFVHLSGEIVKEIFIPEIRLFVNNKAVFICSKEEAEERLHFCIERVKIDLSNE